MRISWIVTSFLTISNTAIYLISVVKKITLICFINCQNIEFSAIFIIVSIINLQLNLSSAQLISENVIKCRLLKLINLILRFITSCR